MNHKQSAYFCICALDCYLFWLLSAGCNTTRFSTYDLRGPVYFQSPTITSGNVPHLEKLNASFQSYFILFTNPVIALWRFVYIMVNGRLLLKVFFFSQPVPPQGGAETESQNYLSGYVCMYVRCYLLILLQSFQCRGGIISDLCSLCRS